MQPITGWEMLFHFSVEKTEAQKEWGAHAEPQLAEVRPAAGGA